jgi:hypothetical protein
MPGLMIIMSLVYILKLEIMTFLSLRVGIIAFPIGTEEYSLAQQYVFKLIKPGYMFQLYSHHQAYLQSLVELYMLKGLRYMGSQ